MHRFGPDLPPALAKWLSGGTIRVKRPESLTSWRAERIDQTGPQRVGRQRLHQMRICLYTCTALPKLGGQEAVVDSLARHFGGLGHEAVVLAPRPRSSFRTDDAALSYAVLRHPRFVSTRHFVGWYRRFLLAAHARRRFDIVHCHDVYPSGYVAALAKPQLGVPLVMTSHGGDVREGNVRMAKPRVRERHVLAVRSADALVSIGPFTEQGFRRLATNLPRLVTIPNGIDPQPFESPAPRPAWLDSGVQQNRFGLFLGRLAHRKGVDLLLGAMAKLPAGRGIQLVIAGTGDEQSSLETLATRSGLADRVRFVGRVGGADKVYLLQNALFTVMPSRVWEAFPLVVLESYAAGRPIVGTDIPGIADLVQPGRTGVLVPQDDADALARAMGELFESPQRAAEMGERARIIAQDYSWDSIARRHIQLYEQLRRPA